MPAYKFEALDAAGKATTGLLEAENAKAARGQLRAQALVPLAVTPVASAGTQAEGLRFTGFHYEDPPDGGAGAARAIEEAKKRKRKASTTDTVAFDTVHADLPRPLVAASLPDGRPSRVDLLALYPGVSPGTIASAVAPRAAGIVLSATGSGNTHPDITAEVNLATQNNVTVVVSSRVPHGRVDPTYGGGGGGVDLVRAGAVFSPWLRAPQARMALIALLTGGATADDVRDFFTASSPS